MRGGVEDVEESFPTFFFVVVVVWLVFLVFLFVCFWSVDISTQSPFFRPGLVHRA